MWFSIGKKKIIAQWVNFDNDAKINPKLEQKRRFDLSTKTDLLRFVQNSRTDDSDKKIFEFLINHCYNNNCYNFPIFKYTMPPWFTIPQFKEAMNIVCKTKFDDNIELNQELINDAIDTSVLLFILYRDNQMQKFANIVSKIENVHNFCTQLHAVIDNVDHKKLSMFLTSALERNFMQNNIIEAIQNFNSISNLSNLTTIGQNELSQIIKANIKIGEEKFKFLLHEDSTKGKIFRYLYENNLINEANLNDLDQMTEFFEKALARRKELLYPFAGTTNLPIRENISYLPEIPIKKNIVLRDKRGEKTYNIIFRLIPCDDVRQLFLGEYCEYPCCFLWNGQSKEAVEDSIANPKSGNYEILLVTDNDVRKLATSYTWIDNSDRICFDNIELSNDAKYNFNGRYTEIFYDNRNIQNIKKAIVDIYLDAANYLMGLGFQSVTVGKSYTDFYINIYNQEMSSHYACNESDFANTSEKQYTDADEQIILAIPKTKMKRDIILENPNSDLITDRTIILSENIEWIKNRISNFTVEDLVNAILTQNKELIKILIGKLKNFTIDTTDTIKQNPEFLLGYPVIMGDIELLKLLYNELPKYLIKPSYLLYKQFFENSQNPEMLRFIGMTMKAPILRDVNFFLEACETLKPEILSIIVNEMKIPFSQLDLDYLIVKAKNNKNILNY
jgi:hypothetical protein